MKSNNSKTSLLPLPSSSPRQDLEGRDLHSLLVEKKTQNLWSESSWSSLATVNLASHPPAFIIWIFSHLVCLIWAPWPTVPEDLSDWLWFTSALFYPIEPPTCILPSILWLFQYNLYYRVTFRLCSSDPYPLCTPALNGATFHIDTGSLQSPKRAEGSKDPFLFVLA